MKLGNGVLVHEDFTEIPLWAKARRDHGANHAHRPSELFSAVIPPATRLLAKVGSQMRTAVVLSWEPANTLVTSIPTLLINKYQVTF